MYDDGPTVERALESGARAFVLKGDGIRTVQRAIGRVFSGEIFLSDGGSQVAGMGSSGAPDALLTERERQVLRLVAEGYTGWQITDLLQISAKTVENHRGHIMEKLDIHSIAGLVRFAIKSGMVS